MKLFNSGHTMIREQYKMGIYIVCLSMLLYLSRTAIPFLKFLFIPLFIGILIYTIVKYNVKIFKKIWEFLYEYYLMVLLAVILLFSFILSDKLYLTIFKDVCNSAILLSLYFLLSINISQKNDNNVFTKAFLNLLILFAVVISIYGLATSLRVISVGEGIESSISFTGSGTESTQTDANFSLLIVFFGMVSLIDLLRRTTSNIKILIFDFVLSLYSIYIFFSGSRRGLFLLLLIIGLLVFSQLIVYIKRKSINRNLAFGTFNYFLMLALVGIFFWCFVNCTSYTYKTRTIEFLGSKNTDLVRTDIASSIHKYLSIFSNKITYKEIYRRIWTPKLNPYDPDSGWGTRPHQTIYPLTGEKNEIVPTGSKGYLMDRYCSSDSRSGNAYSYTTIFNDSVTQQNILEASTYCFVSKDFDGTWALISCEGSAEGNRENEYDMNFKGTWQKLSIKVNCLDGIANVYLYFSKFGVTDFSTLKGCVIYAHPVVRIIEKNDSVISGSGNFYNILTTDYFNRISNHLIIVHKKNEVFEPLNNIFKNSYKRSQAVSGYIHDENLKLSFAGLNFLTNLSRSKSRFLQVFPLINVHLDPIREWASRIISEDTTYHGFSGNFVVAPSSNNFMSDRLLRWKFALFIFTKEFNSGQEIFGGGFNFLNWYGYYFIKDKTASDWPHNPFLSILLYSGIIGFFLYLFLLYKVFYLYIKYIKDYFIFFVFFLITFFFSFFSAGSPFDPPIMGFFIMLPFFINSIHKNDKGTTNDENFNNR
jgi:hypothetical protein